MNSLFNKNIDAFTARFPLLAKNLSDAIASFKSEAHRFFEISAAKDGTITASENGMLLHSKYNPGREAEQLVSSFDIQKNTTAAFLSVGLGYAPITFAQKYPTVPIIIVEPDSAHLFEAFDALDWSPVLQHKEVAFAITSDAELAAHLLDKYNLDSCKFFSVSSQTAHDTKFYEQLTELLSRQKQKTQINTNTLEKFSHLWLHNSCCNLHYLAELDGVDKYKGCTSLPVVVLAAGPSLQSILPQLPEIKKRSIIVCVDTALHACLEAHVEPDFIILVDPQYACSLHLEFLESPSSVLITESAVYPSVFRFNCKEKVLCSSLFPIGQYFEKQLGSKGKLGAGGSVTTTAWDFARLCGTKEIYLAGMDLGFPGKQTHIRGSQFEERSHRTSYRTFSAETDAVNALLGANPTLALDYNGSPLLTDQRMSLFSWWFETNCRDAEKVGVHTYSLTRQSLAIKGITPADTQAILSKDIADTQKSDFFYRAKQNSLLLRKTDKPPFAEVLADFENDLDTLIQLAKKALSLCEAVLRDRTKAQTAAQKLTAIDNEILCSASKNAASLVFPTERQLEQEADSLPHDKALYSFYYSRLIYQKLQTAAKEYLSTLNLLKIQ